jgi:FMN hydrolase / 5-amino-6-(5-phospho-D-ribitylamino)uracil phosphatase
VTRDIKLISFDLDNTLWDVMPVIRAAEAQIDAWLKEFCPKLFVRFSTDQLQQARMEYWQNHPELRHLTTRVRRDSLRIKLIEAGYCLHQAIELADLAMDVFMEARHRITYFDHALTTLDQLAPHYALAAITNGNASPRRLGLSQFSYHLSAEQVGAAKPSPEPFELCMAMASVDASQMVHIGDCPQDDIAGAASLGIKTIWFNRHKAPWPRVQVQPDAIVHCLSELPAAIALLAHPSPVLQAQSA